MFTFIITLIAGLVFLRQPSDLTGVMNTNGALFFLVTNISFQSITACTLVFPTELPIFIKENKRGMYRIDIYFIARTLADLPWGVLGLVINVTIVYWMAGMRADVVTFFTYVGIFVLMEQVSCVLFK